MDCGGRARRGRLDSRLAPAQFGNLNNNQMKAKLLVVVIFSLVLTFSGENLLGASQKKPQAKNQKEKSGQSSGQATAGKQSKAREQAYAIASSKVPKGARITDRGFVSRPAPKGSYTELCSLRWVLGDQQSKALEQQRKQAAEQRRKQEEAAAQPPTPPPQPAAARPKWRPPEWAKPAVMHTPRLPNMAAAPS